MPNKLINRNNVPRGGVWKYKEPESGVIIEGDSWLELVQNVKNHRAANGYIIPVTFISDVEAGVCELFPAMCKDGSGKDIVPERITWAQVAQFTSIMIESLVKGWPKVDQKEADRRAGICATCPDNVKAEGCTGCNTKRIKQMVQAVAGSSSTKFDSNLESCRHCGCLNKAQIWFPLDILQKHMEKRVSELLPTGCWKK